MNISKSFSGSKEGYCFACHKSINGKKSKECNDCYEKFCLEHIKVDEKAFSAICSKCFRNKVHLEVSMEMETQILNAKSHLNNLKSKLKSTKKEMNNFSVVIDKIQSSLLTKEKMHQKKLESIN